MSQLKQLEQKLKIEWQKAMFARSQAETRRLRAIALETYRQLKFAKELTKGL